ncbi:MAG: OmpA family protein [Proteobacteria bacterium]|nr:OmpA family protein [Pseudomonadota bacterium]
MRAIAGATKTKGGLIVASVMMTSILAGCVSRSDYDALKSQNEQLQQQVATQQQQLAQANAQVSRLQGAIKYTVNSDLLFAPGSWTMSSRGKGIIAGFAKKLAPTMQNKLLVSGFTDNAPIGPALAAQGVTSNEILSQKRADAVMQFLISQGLSPELVTAKGFGDAHPVASNATAAGRAKNRRVELSIAGPAS